MLALISLLLGIRTGNTNIQAFSRDVGYQVPYGWFILPDTGVINLLGTGKSGSK